MSFVRRPWWEMTVAAGGLVEIMVPDTSLAIAASRRPRGGTGARWAAGEERDDAAPAECLVVVIEDDGLVRTAVSAYLEALGCEVRAAESAEAASDLWEALPREPSLMICDYGLPRGANGLQVISSARRQLGRDFTAYLMTGMVSQDVMTRCREVGVPIIYKPVSPGILKSIVERARG